MRLFLLSLLVTLTLVASSHAQVVTPTPDEMPVVELTANNTLVLGQSITPDYGMMFTMGAVFTRAALPADQTLYILIYSPGGRTDVAEALSATLNELPNTKLVCVRCASAAAWIFEKSTEQRLILPTSEIIMHEIGIFVRPSTIDRVDIATFKADGEKFNAVFMERMSMTAEEYHEMIDGTDWSVMADEMMERNLADQMVVLQCDEAVSQAVPEACGAE